MKLSVLIIIICGSIAILTTSCEIEAVTPEYSMNVQLYGNPNAIDVGRNASLDVYIKNTGRLNDTIQSIKLIFPNLTVFSDVLANPYNLGVNRTLLKHFEVNLPEDIRAGKYAIGVLVTTLKNDYVAASELTINRLESISLSGNVPLYLLVLIVSGLITYLLPTLYITRKFQRSYVEITLFSIILGFVNWSVARYIGLTKYIENLHNDTVAALAVIGLGAAFGGIFIVAYLVYKYFMSERTKRDLKKYERESVLRRGFQITGSTNQAWLTFLTRRLNFANENLGRNYSITIRVYLRLDSSRLTYIEGIWELSEEKRPIDISILPKRILLVEERNLIFEVLTTYKEIIDEVLKSDKIYRKRITEDEVIKASLSRKKVDKPEYSEIRDAILSEMKKIIDDGKEFSRFMQRIDFSRFVVRTAYYFRNDEKIRAKVTMNMRYQGPVFIPFESIAHVEILGYETRYAIAVKGEEEVPKTFIVANVSVIEDRTID